MPSAKAAATPLSQPRVRGTTKLELLLSPCITGLRPMADGYCGWLVRDIRVCDRCETVRLSERSPVPGLFLGKLYFSSLFLYRRQTVLLSPVLCACHVRI